MSSPNMPLRRQFNCLVRGTFEGQTYAVGKTRKINGEKGEVPTRQFDTGRAENLPERVNCASR